MAKLIGTNVHRVRDFLTDQPVTVKQIAKATGLAPVRIRDALFQLSLKGEVVQVGQLDNLGRPGCRRENVWRKK